MENEDKMESWAVLDMDGGALHSVHIFKEDADKAAWGLGNVARMILDKNDSGDVMERYNFAETGMGYKRLQYDPKGEWVKYEEVKEAFKRGFVGGVRNSGESTIRRLTYALEHCESLLNDCARQECMPDVLKSYILDANKTIDRALKDAWILLRPEKKENKNV